MSSGALYYLLSEQKQRDSNSFEQKEHYEAQTSHKQSSRQRSQSRLGT